MWRHRITWGCFQTVQRVTCCFELAIFPKYVPVCSSEILLWRRKCVSIANPLRPVCSTRPYVFSLTQRRVTSARNKRGVDLDMCIGDHHINVDIIEIGNEGVQLTVVCLRAMVLSFLSSWNQMWLEHQLFYMSLTVHLGIILVNNQLHALFSMYLFISPLYMFWATQCSSSGESNCINTSSGICPSV